jgi:hypothetical protein
LTRPRHRRRAATSCAFGRGSPGICCFLGALCGDVTAKWLSGRPLLADCSRPQAYGRGSSPRPYSWCGYGVLSSGAYCAASRKRPSLGGHDPRTLAHRIAVCRSLVGRIRPAGIVHEGLVCGLDSGSGRLAKSRELAGILSHRATGDLGVRIGAAPVFHPQGLQRHHDAADGADLESRSLLPAESDATLEVC